MIEYGNLTLSKCTTWSLNSATLAKIPHVALCVFHPTGHGFMNLSSYVAINRLSLDLLVFLSMLQIFL